MKHKNTPILLILVVVLIFTSCQSTFKVVNIDSQTEENSGLIYLLPQTKIIFDFEITEIKKIQGPFADYSNLYFNSKNSIQKNEVEYIISDVSIKTVPIKDQDNIYSLISDDHLTVSMLNLTPEGFLAGVNLSDYQAEKVQTEQKIITKSYTKDNKLDYADFSLKSIRETSYDTLYKEVLRDSVLVKIPIIRKKKVFKSPEKQAKEIADILFLLRDDRNALLKGENDGNNFPDGEALKIMITELNKLERQYMSLFTGRETETSFHYNYELAPDNDSLTFNLFNFSNKTGISNDSSDQKIVLKVSPDKTIQSIYNFNLNKFSTFKSQNPAYEGLIYRIPADVIVEILIDDVVLYRKQIRVSQMGTLNMIPGNIINEHTTIEFHPNYGSLKRISQVGKEED